MGSSELDDRISRYKKHDSLSATKECERGVHLQFRLYAEGAFVVGVNSCTVLSKHLFHADVGMVDGILTHRGGSNAPIRNTSGYYYGTLRNLKKKKLHIKCLTRASRQERLSKR